MRLLQQIKPLRSYLRAIRQDGKSIGYVPTMGSLHEGHLSLFRRARADCDTSVVSIFVNPRQFGPNEDYTAYPRDPHGDAQLASTAGVDAIFIPAADHIYPKGFQTRIEVETLSQLLEGVSRPGHFSGVATVVAKLLNIVQPDIAYFGQKDYQQALLIERMVTDLNIPIEVRIEPTVREADGLALSSRNAYLSQEEREAAAILYKSLQCVREKICDGVRDPHHLIQAMENRIKEEPLAKVDYITIADPKTLIPLKSSIHDTFLAALAVRIGSVRLLDNMLFSSQGESVIPGRNRHNQESDFRNE